MMLIDATVAIHVTAGSIVARTFLESNSEMTGKNSAKEAILWQEYHQISTVFESKLLHIIFWHLIEAFTVNT